MVSSIEILIKLKEQLYGVHQEVSRKMSERLLSVLCKNYQILYRPCRLWFIRDMNDIVRI